MNLGWPHWRKCIMHCTISYSIMPFESERNPKQKRWITCWMMVPTQGSKAYSIFWLMRYLQCQGMIPGLHKAWEVWPRWGVFFGGGGADRECHTQSCCGVILTLYSGVIPGSSAQGTICGIGDSYQVAAKVATYKTNHLLYYTPAPPLVRLLIDVPLGKIIHLI